MLKRKNFHKPGENKASRTPTPASIYAHPSDPEFSEDRLGPNRNNTIRFGTFSSKFFHESNVLHANLHAFYHFRVKS